MAALCICRKISLPNPRRFRSALASSVPEMKVQLSRYYKDLIAIAAPES